MQNDIPVFSPALTDGSLGDIMYFHSFKKPGLILDIVEGKNTATVIKRSHRRGLPVTHLSDVAFQTFAG